MTPPKLTGKEFEDLLLAGAERSATLTMTRYGVKGVTLFDEVTKKPRIVLVQSNPDFDGAMLGGRQFVIEAKVCAEPSFKLRPDKIKPSQVSFMLERSRFGVPCYLVIHWCERVGQNFRDPAITVAVPVHGGNPLWQKFLDACAAAKRSKTKLEAQGSISRSQSQDLGRVVVWTAPGAARKHLPDLERILESSTQPPPKKINECYPRTQRSR